MIVPVGASASVRLPGRDEQTVGHGRHRWEVPDPCRTSSRPPRTVRDVLDDPALWAEVVTAAVGVGLAADETATAKRLTPFLDAPAGDLVDRLFSHGSRNGLDALQEQLQPLLRP